MNLIIDIGNSRVKAAMVEDNTIVRQENLTGADTELLELLITGYKPEAAILSSVSSDASALLSWLDSRVGRVFHLTPAASFPFTIDYGTPETLGPDRLAAAAGAVCHHPGTDLLVIDAGSAVTIDLVSGGVFRGGSISPGLSMRFRALHEQSGRLPLVEKRSDFTFPGRTTEDAIAGGVIMGMAYEIIEYIRTFENMHQNLVTLITGGDGALLEPLTDGRAVYHPDLVTEGMNYILETNV